MQRKIFKQFKNCVYLDWVFNWLTAPQIGIKKSSIIGLLKSEQAVKNKYRRKGENKNNIKKERKRKKLNWTK